MSSKFIWGVVSIVIVFNVLLFSSVSRDVSTYVEGIHEQQLAQYGIYDDDNY